LKPFPPWPWYGLGISIASPSIILPFLSNCGVTLSPSISNCGTTKSPLSSNFGWIIFPFLSTWTGNGKPSGPVGGGNIFPYLSVGNLYWVTGSPCFCPTIGCDDIISPCWELAWGVEVVLTSVVVSGFLLVVVWASISNA